MRPILFRIPWVELPIYGYGVMIALGFLAGTWYIQKESARLELDSQKALDLIFYILVVSLFGSRIPHVFINERDAFFQNPLILFKIWQGGLVFYGGVLSALLFSIWYIRKHKLPFWRYGDLFMPALALGHAIGRLGCFLAGCCHGRPVLHPAWYAVIFPDHVHSFAPPNIPLYPTQLMESGAEFLIFLFLILFRKKKKFHGEIFALYLMLYSVVRGIIEFYRGDLDRGWVVEPWLSTSQFISLVLFAVGVFFFWKNRKNPLLEVGHE